MFVCYASYDDPQIAISIAVEKGGSGSSLASIAAEILQYYFTAQDGQGQIPAENTLVPDALSFAFSRACGFEKIFDALLFRMWAERRRFQCLNVRTTVPPAERTAPPGT